MATKYAPKGRKDKATLPAVNPGDKSLDPSSKQNIVVTTM
jgi:hypothetical protein